MEHEGLAADRVRLGASRVEQVADVLRSRISTGYFEPGNRLAEDEITTALRVSRNTLREAFRLLTNERLLEHQLNRGMFVRLPGVADVVDVYRVRKRIECSVVGAVVDRPPTLEPIADAVRQGRAALAEQDWKGLGTANIRFHQEIVAMDRSPRLDDVMRSVLAELRLVFHVMRNPRWFHEPYLARNQEILAALEEGNGAEGERLLAKYLDDAEEQLVEAVRLRRP